MTLMKNDNCPQALFEQVVYLTRQEQGLSNVLNTDTYNRTFDESVKSFILSFSRALMALPGAKRFPDLVALAFWMRKSNIHKLEQEFKQGNNYRVPVGRVLHFAPSNVDTIFIYSLFLSLLVGNANIVRVSEKSTEQQKLLISLINAELDKPEYSFIKDYLTIITYPHSDSLSAELCSKTDMRVIWGGDETVRKITSFPISPSATELKFSNKYSLCLMDPAKLESLDSSSYNELVKRFVNDTYWFGQQGCSSPRTVIWLSCTNFDEQIERFWNAVAGQAQEMFTNDIVAADIMNRIVAMQLAAVSKVGLKVRNDGKMLSRVTITDINRHNSLREIHCGSGLFFEISVEQLSKLRPMFDRKVQTVSYFGFDANSLRDLMIEACLFPDRVVPVGNALDFSNKWDGFDLLNNLTRIVDFK